MSTCNMDFERLIKYFKKEKHFFLWFTLFILKFFFTFAHKI